jgi:hypothetical protein
MELGEFLFQLGRWQTGIDQGSQHHVPAGTGDAVKVGNAHGGDWNRECNRMHANVAEIAKE